ncbi:hypothetical protein [Neobacillus kokaensis]|uniref:Uncharacterized protein n=1 Tax=Neobacillus kokaensis TaxID=2759023 RepID=A0ABQ3MZR9_9BACI|nr:hypothetical protein [Neobacillus kokaensis]GHH96892.1 hypothetical protein AM1BK_04350 [Neobacillus kokaensis]
MTTEAPQSEQIQYLPPKGEYETFRDEEHMKEKLKEWGLSTAKKEFWYKDRNFQQPVSIKGYEIYGNTAEFNTLIIEFPDGKLTSIHPAFLKEMQQSSFGKESLITALEDKEIKEMASDKDSSSANEAEPEVETAIKKAESKTSKPSEPKPKKAKAAKLELPAEKVHFTANVKQFAFTYNPFNEENDEVVVLENVQIQQENPLDLGLAWCSHSKTLKKFELAPGELLEFDGKVVAKKLAKGKDVEEEFIVEAPVLYKINNPSKLMKK